MFSLTKLLLFVFICLCSGKWTNIAGKLKQIDVGGRFHVWGVTHVGRIYRRGFGGWEFISGYLKHVSVGHDGAVWGVNDSDQIFKRVNYQWVRIAGGLKQISVGSASCVWGVNSSGNIFKRVGSSWERVPGTLNYVSAGKDCIVWGTQSSGAIYKRVGSSWVRVPGTLKQVEVGGHGQIWGTQSSGAIYKREYTGWTRIPGTLAHVSVGWDGTVWGVQSNFLIWFYHDDCSAYAEAVKSKVIGDANAAKTVNAESVVDTMDDATDIEMENNGDVMEAMVMDKDGLFDELKGAFRMHVENIAFVSIIVNVLLLGIIFGGVYSKCKSVKIPKYHTLSETTTESE